jgi:hypothetical protein
MACAPARRERQADDNLIDNLIDNLALILA